MRPTPKRFALLGAASNKLQRPSWPACSNKCPAPVRRFGATLVSAVRLLCRPTTPTVAALLSSARQRRPSVRGVATCDGESSNAQAKCEPLPSFPCRTQQTESCWQAQRRNLRASRHARWRDALGEAEFLRGPSTAPPCLHATLLHTHRPPSTPNGPLLDILTPFHLGLHTTCWSARHVRRGRPRASSPHLATQREQR